jgi:hypothetical protein
MGDSWVTNRTDEMLCDDARADLAAFADQIIDLADVCICMANGDLGDSFVAGQFKAIQLIAKALGRRLLRGDLDELCSRCEEGR